MGGSGKPGFDIGTGETVSTGGMQRGPNQSQEIGPGMMIGEYRIEGLLGEGGMGRVYSAIHPVIAKRAAVKVLHPELSINREAVERFVQEARSVNQIGHPNIVDIFAFGTLPDGRCYFVMEWLRGMSLRDRIRESPVQIVDGLQFLETIAVALEAAHEKGIVHRDLKPDNVFLCEVKGTLPNVKLLDFGIAKLLGPDDARAERTRTGNLMGTPAYISPEQARGHMVDHRTDIYALGALAYELFTGWLPFPADSAADMIAKHLYEHPPSARTRNPNLPPDLDNLIIAMLAKDVNSRPTLEQIRNELRRLRQGGYAQMQGYPPGQQPYPGMPTPGPQMMQTPHTGPVPQMYTPMHTPYPQQTGTAPPGQMMPAPTPAPGTMSVVGTGMGSQLQPARRSKLPIILVGLIVLGGAGAGVFFGVINKQDAKQTDTSAEPPATPTETTPMTVPRTPPTPPTTDTAVTPPETKPADTTTPPPVDTTATKPADTATPPPVDTTATKPADTTATKPADTTATKPKTTRPKTKTTKPKTTTTKPAGGDDDAPM